MKTKSISITNNWRGFEVIFRLHGVEPATERVSSFIFTLCHYVGLAVRDDLSGGVSTMYAFNLCLVYWAEKL